MHTQLLRPYLLMTGLALGTTLAGLGMRLQLPRLLQPHSSVAVISWRIRIVNPRISCAVSRISKVQSPLFIKPRITHKASLVRT